MISDEKIMSKAKSGNTDSISLLFDRYCDYLYNYFNKLCHSRQVAEDLTQNVFLRIIKYRTSFNEGMSFKSWIFQIARNQFYDYLEKHKKELEIQAELSRNEKQVNDSGDHHERYEKLDIALDSLPLETREILVLAKYQHYKYKDLANTYNTSEAAIKVKVHRGIKELRTKYFELIKQ